MELLRDHEFWVLVAFIVGVSLLIWKGGPAFTRGLDDRAARIRQQLDEAQRLRDEAEAMLADYQRKQRDALSEAEAIVARAKADAERIGAEAVAALEAQLKRREAQATQRIAQSEAQAVSEVRAAAVDVAIEAARRLLRESLDEQRGGALINTTIAELAGQLH
jgi:F-type H+-transporting ATPase subunit b